MKIEVQLNEIPNKQISLTDLHAGSMKARGTGMVGYNVQAGVDVKHHLVVTHEVTNNGVDRDQLVYDLRPFPLGEHASMHDKAIPPGTRFKHRSLAEAGS